MPSSSAPVPVASISCASCGASYSLLSVEDPSAPSDALYVDVSTACLACGTSVHTGSAKYKFSLVAKRPEQ